MSAVIIDFRTRENRQSAAYGAGNEEFCRFLNDRIGLGWWIGQRPVKHMAHRPRVTQRQFNALEAEFRRLYGPTHFWELGAR
jgi:hypothetical protein